jgi:hypothetical protein
MCRQGRLRQAFHGGKTALWMRNGTTILLLAM